MKLSQAGLDLLKKLEGFKSCPYLDQVKIPTIGIGTTVYPNGVLVTMNDPCIDINQAYEYVKLHIENNINKYTDSLIKAQLAQNQQDALICLIYNIGIGGFKKSTVLKQLNINPLDREKITSAFMMWNKSKGSVLPGLTARRREELALFFKA